MNFNDFDPADAPSGSKQVFYLDIGAADMKVAVVVVRGAKPGARIAVLGGVHGDEYEGPYAARRAFEGLDPTELRGTFVGVPHSNPPAFHAGTRTSPLDGLNLARVFPGDESGSPTERIAHYIGEHIIKGSDFLIDLHSSGTPMDMATLVGYHISDTDAGKRSREAAFAFGAPVLWAHPEMTEGRTLSRAHELGIPSLYTETSGGGWLHREAGDLYTRGVENVMSLLDMLPGDVTAATPERHLMGAGDTDEAIGAGATGYLVPEVSVLDRVSEGDVLGRILGPAGEVLEELRAESDGVVILMRRTPTVSAGDQTFLLTQEAPS